MEERGEGRSFQSLTDVRDDRLAVRSSEDTVAFLPELSGCCLVGQSLVTAALSSWSESFAIVRADLNPRYRMHGVDGYRFTIWFDEDIGLQVGRALWILMKHMIDVQGKSPGAAVMRIKFLLDTWLEFQDTLRVHLIEDYDPGSQRN